MGQKTGTSNTEKKVITEATTKAFVIAYLKDKEIVVMGGYIGLEL
jgi:aspartokinase